MLPRLIIKSLKLRKKRLAIATLAVLLASTLVTALVNLSLDIGAKAGSELEAYGANLLLLPRTMSLPAGAGRLAFGEVTGEGYMDDRVMSYLESGQKEAVKAYAPYLYAIAERKGQRIVVAGVRFDNVRALAPYWQLNGTWPEGTGRENQSIVGSNVARRFSLNIGDDLPLEFGGNSRTFRVEGIVQVGGSEDNQVFIDLGMAQALVQRPRQVDMLQMRAAPPGKDLRILAAELEKDLPGVQARVVGQIAGNEEKVLFKVQLLIGLITALILLVSALAVFSTITASVLERTKEIGLMKALGARSRGIVLTFMAEAWAIGLGGGTAGIVVGLGLGQLIGRNVFNTYLAFYTAIIPVTLITAMLTTTLASLWPVTRALAVEPVIALRGE